MRLDTIKTNGYSWNSRPLIRGGATMDDDGVDTVAMMAVAGEGPPADR
jgi:hypothetical protein